MNKKTPNRQTQSAMTEARAMARNRIPERVESIPADIRQRPLSNFWCGRCHETTNTDFSGALMGGDLLLVGKRAECRSDLA
jgi:hypothetical protein